MQTLPNKKSKFSIIFTLSQTLLKKKHFVIYSVIFQIIQNEFLIYLHPYIMLFSCKFFIKHKWNALSWQLAFSCNNVFWNDCDSVHLQTSQSLDIYKSFLHRHKGTSSHLPQELDKPVTLTNVLCELSGERLRKRGWFYNWIFEK